MTFEQYGIDRARRNLLWREHGDRGIRRQIMRQGHQAIDERWRERLHSVDGDALADLGEHRRETRKLVLHLPGALAHALAEQHLPARWELGLGDLGRQRALVCDREFANLLELVTEEFEAKRMLVGGREHVDDATAHREFPPPRHHVDPGICEVDKPTTEVGEIVSASPLRQQNRLDLPAQLSVAHLI